MPFHKWTGGKRWIAPVLLGLLPPGKRLLTPFYGGGGESHPAIASGRWEEFVLSDLNPHLVAAHEEVRDGAGLLLGRLRAFSLLSAVTQEVAFYYLRDLVPAKKADRAFRFLILVGCAFNGLWRENSGGWFNAPFGGPLSVDGPAVLETAALLSRPGVSLTCRDFEETVDLAGPGDVVYADPPYHPRTKTASFDAYCGKRFSTEEHGRLAAALVRAGRRGAETFVSDHDVAAARETYRGGVTKITAPRRGGADPKSRGTAREILVRVDWRRY